MVFSYYLYRIPYTIIYKILNSWKKTLPVVFYCPSYLDWEIFQPVQKFLQPLPILTDNRQTEALFLRQKRTVYRMPFFPKAVIMCRHSCHKFPAKDIIKIGMRHGPYHFKRLTKAANFNLFDLYLMTSEADQEAAEKIGVNCSKSVGFPKLDRAFNGELNEETLQEYYLKAKIDKAKKTILFTATWIESGMSAFFKWSERVGELSDTFNIIVSLHPWIDKQHRQVISSTPGIFFIEKEETLPYIMISDYCVGDTSSILGECCALNKPIITFRCEIGKRGLEEIEEIIDSISLRIERFEELLPAIEKYEAFPGLREKERAAANRIMFDKLDGKAGLRAAEEIVKLLPELRKE
jgi:hypothetical protein